MKESATTSHVRWAAAQKGATLLRNNSGGFYDATGRFVRYGLGSYTAKDDLASSDYIGWIPEFITPAMVGTVIARALAVEMKPSDWKFSPSDERACKQKNFHDMLLRDGGYAGFARNEQDLLRIIHRDQN